MVNAEIYVTKEEIIEKSKKNILQKELNTKEILAVLGICGVIGAYGYSFVYPGYKEYKTVKDNLNTINTQITEYENRVVEMPVLQEKLEDLQREVRLKSKIVGHKMEDGMFMIGLSKVMQDVKVNLVDYTVEEVIPYDTFYAIPTSLTVRGDYRHIREVMYYLEEQKNMTQILDYSMETHIKEDKNTSTTNTNSSVSTTMIPDSTVYWTSTGAAYHKDTCIVLEEEKKASGEEMLLSGAASVSNRTSACQVCKPYTVSVVNQEQTQTETQKPKADGTIEATFKFIMYSSENPKLELGNDDSSTWKPGKYNPFTTTTR